MGNRMSSLPVSRYCPKASKLGEKYGAGRAALMGSTFHAVCSDPGGEETKLLLMQLTESEMEDILQWHKPTDIDLGDTVLSYAIADKEFEVALNSQAGRCAADDPDCITVGHVDCAWVVETEWSRIAYVCDLKKSEWTVKTAPEKSLQLLAYGLATAQKLECDSFCVGIWACMEGGYDWSDIIELDGDVAKDAWERVKHAAMNTEGEARTGAHCSDDCYGRLHCEEHLLPGAMALQPDTLAAMQEDSEDEMNNATALELLLLSKSVEDVLKVVKGNLKAYARRQPIVDEASGKRYCAVESRGKMGLDKAQLERDQPGLLDKYQRRGNPFPTMKWKNI